MRLLQNLPLSNCSIGLILVLVLVDGSPLDKVDKLSVSLLGESFSAMHFPLPFAGSTSSPPSPGPSSSSSSVESSRAAANAQALRSLQLGVFPSDDDSPPL